MSGGRHCRLCKSTDLAPLLELDDLPVSHLLRADDSDPDPRLKITFDACRGCGLLQIVDAPLPELIYAGTETYMTGFQNPRHLDDLIATTIARQDPGRTIDVGCNDGALLEALSQAGYTDLVGVEPNRAAAAHARALGHQVHVGFLTASLADRLVVEQGKFDTVFLRHVVEHVGDLDEFFDAVRRLLREDGLLVVELPEVEEALSLGSPAIFWEEHLSYFTAGLAEHMLGRNGFEVTDRRRYAFGGGALAYLARKGPMPMPGSVPPAVAEHTNGLLAAFAARLRRQATALREVVAAARATGWQVMMYGAAPRSCLIVSASRIAQAIDVVVDDRREIHGRLMPGTRCVISPLDGVPGRGISPLLCLLGVGAENEFRVRDKMRESWPGEMVFVSLFPPRDASASIEAARAAVTDRGRG